MQIPNATTLTQKQKEDLITFICFKHQKHNILNLRKVVGDEGLLSLINKFAGTYTRFPTISVVVKMANEMELVRLYDELKDSAMSGDPKKWQEAENRFVKFAESKFGLTYLEGKHTVKKFRKVLDEAKMWYSNLTNWEKRNSDAE